MSFVSPRKKKKIITVTSRETSSAVTGAEIRAHLALRWQKGEKKQQNLNNITVGFLTSLLILNELFSHTCPTAVIFKSSVAPAHAPSDQQPTLNPQVQQCCLNLELPKASGVPRASSGRSLCFGNGLGNLERWDVKFQKEICSCFN